MAGGKKGRGCEAPALDREWFIHQNAVALVRSRDDKIARLRRQVTKDNRRIRSLKAEVRRLQPKLAVNREDLGKIVRAAYVVCKLEELAADNTVDARHMTPWADLPEREKETDRRIGEAVTATVTRDLFLLKEQLARAERDCQMLRRYAAFLHSCALCHDAPQDLETFLRHEKRAQ